MMKILVLYLLASWGHCAATPDTVGGVDDDEVVVLLEYARVCAGSSWGGGGVLDVVVKVRFGINCNDKKICISI